MLQQRERKRGIINQLITQSINSDQGQLTCGYVHRPGEQLTMRRVGVIQPKVVITARQHAGQLDILPNLAGRDGGVRLWVAGRRTVVDAVEGVVIAAGIWHADDQIGAMCGLWMKERREVNELLLLLL